jgi:hypothetical protein
MVNAARCGKWSFAIPNAGATALAPPRGCRDLPDASVAAGRTRMRWVATHSPDARAHSEYEDYNLIIINIIIIRMQFFE